MSELQENASQRLAAEAAEAATASALEDAVALLPQTFVHFSDPEVLLRKPPPPSDVQAREEAAAAALATHISPLVQAQVRQTTDKPVVTTTDKILNSILPPRVFSYVDPSSSTEVLMVQAVSREQASRPELRELRELLDFKLTDAKARMRGLCPVRRAIFSMLFDELIRQVTVGCAERGLLLLRMRDEAALSIDAYTSLCSSAAHYDTTKLHHASKGTPEMLAKIQSLSSDTETLRREVRRLETRHLSLLRCCEEQKAADQRRYNAEKAFLRETTDRLQTHLAAVKEMQETERRAMMVGGSE